MTVTIVFAVVGLVIAAGCGLGASVLLAAAIAMQRRRRGR